MSRSLLHSLPGRWPGLALVLIGLLLLIYRPAPATRADGGPALPVQALGRPQVTTAQDAQATRIAPALRQAIAGAGQPDTLLPVIVVSQGPLATNVLQHAVARRPDARGLVFTAGQAPAGQVGALAVPGNVIAVLSGAAPPLPV